MVHQVAWRRLGDAQINLTRMRRLGDARTNFAKVDPKWRIQQEEERRRKEEEDRKRDAEAHVQWGWKTKYRGITHDDLCKFPWRDYEIVWSAVRRELKKRGLPLKDAAGFLYKDQELEKWTRDQVCYFRSWRQTGAS